MALWLLVQRFWAIIRRTFQVQVDTSQRFPGLLVSSALLIQSAPLLPARRKNQEPVLVLLPFQPLDNPISWRQFKGLFGELRPYTMSL